MTENDSTTLDRLLKSPNGIAAVAFAVSLSSGDPATLLAGSGVRWNNGCNGVAIQGGTAIRKPSLEDFVELKALGRQLAVYATTLTQIAAAGEREAAEEKE